MALRLPIPNPRGRSHICVWRGCRVISQLPCLRRMSKLLKFIPGILLIFTEVLSLVAAPQSFAHAQTAAYADIAAIDVQKFPQISALVDIYDPDGQFISGL